MAARRPAWSGPIVQAVERIHQIRTEINQLQMEETVLREAVLTALKGVSEDEFPVRLGSHDVRVQTRSGRLEKSAALARLTSLGLDQELARVPEIVSLEAIALWEETLSQVSMPVKSRERLVNVYQTAIERRPEINIEQLKAWKVQKRLSDADYAQCFKDGKAVVYALTIR